ncbi:MAG: ATP-binding protein, partial [Christensenellales bacterium]
AKYPARAMLVAAMNPCPCGNYGSATQPCRCTQKEIARYLGRISGPLLDRIDMQLEVTAVPVRQITESAPEEPSADIHKRVQAARERQQKRYAGEGISCNAELSARQLETFCPLDDACRELLGKACDTYHLSMRAVSRVRKVARTIADLAGAEEIGRAHLLEALRYRNLEGNYWK